MVKEETWSVSIQRARAFFHNQEDVTEEGNDLFRFRSCRIALTQLQPRAAGIWAVSRVRLRLEGEEGDVRAIYHRFFIQFLSAGG